jgi:hypothetical protein
MSETDSKNSGPTPQGRSQEAAREQRLAKALRDNLRRRKAPAATESEVGGESGGEGPR